MYEEAEQLGIDLMSFDQEESSSEERKDIRKAILLLSGGKTIPEDLRKRLLARKNRNRISRPVK